MGGTNTWKQLERGEISVEEYYVNFENEVNLKGGKIPPEFSPQKLLSIISSSLHFRSEMIDAIHTIKRKGLKVVALTNNWKPSENDTKSNFHHLGLFTLFDEVFEV